MTDSLQGCWDKPRRAALVSMRLTPFAALSPNGPFVTLPGRALLFPSFSGYTVQLNTSLI